MRGICRGPHCAPSLVCGRDDVALARGTLQADDARRAGFWTFLIYVCAGDVEENLQRVARRGLRGGHAAHEAEIRDIFAKSLDNLAAARPVFDEADLYDTSVRWAPPVRVVALRDGKLASASPLPAWVPAPWKPS